MGETPAPERSVGERGGERSGPPARKPWKTRDGSINERKAVAANVIAHLFLLKVKPGNPKRAMESKQQITILIVDVTPINQKLMHISLEIRGTRSSPPVTEYRPGNLSSETCPIRIFREIILSATLSYL
jgi:hypothetical protein